MDKSDLKTLVDKRLSQRKIAEIKNVSQTTVRYWLYMHGLKTTPKSLHEGEGKYITSVCNKHGETEFVYEPSKGGYRCKRCRSGRVSDDRRKLKREAVESLGGKCSICGYSKSTWALHFHHRERKDKEHGIGVLVRDRKKKQLMVEIQKCNLVCANCHAELEERYGEAP